MNVSESQKTYPHLVHYYVRATIRADARELWFFDRTKQHLYVREKVKHLYIQAPLWYTQPVKVKYGRAGWS